jgi:Ca2+-binding RTX toxin-like protein/beta-mannanase
MALLGAYLGNGNAQQPVAAMVTDYKEWLGRDVNMLAVHTGTNGWSDWSSSIPWQMWNYREVISDHTMHWSIPLIPAWDATMGEASTGSYNSKYIEAAKVLAGSPGTGPIYVRTGWEFNATWSPVTSSAIGQPDNYIGAFRNFVDSFRSVSDRFVFEWTPNIGNHGMNPADAYPGDKYVDVIGMDFYWNAKASWSITDPVKAFNYFVNQEYGLQWLENFAAEHGKPTAYSEWAVNSPNGAAYMELVQQWFSSHNVLYTNYWESNAAFPGMLREGQYGETGTAFQKLFGGASLPAPDAEPPPPPLPDVPEKPLESGSVQGWMSFKGNTGTVYGNEKNNVLIGSGNVIMEGGQGDDRYTVNSGQEKITEYYGQGIDTVTSYAKTYTLSGNVENLVLNGQYDQHGTGNELRNIITGNSYRNIINGGRGDDWLTGGTASDLFITGAGAGHDVITDFHADDVLKIEGFSFMLFSEMKNFLYQNGSNVSLLLDGQTVVTFLNRNVADFLEQNFMFDVNKGTDGDDRYLVTDKLEQIIEAENGGIDTVSSWANSYTLAANVENLVLLSGNWVKQTGRGNELDNIVRGGDGENILYGGKGDDTLSGGGGKDILYGEDGNDFLVGGTGYDIMAGGTGADIFRLELNAGNEAPDRIKDFRLSDQDMLDLSKILEGPDLLPGLLDNFVRITAQGFNKTVEVDVTGIGLFWQQAAVLENAKDVNSVSDLTNNGSLLL